MRALLTAFGVSAALLLGSATQAAPTCKDMSGDTRRCGAVGAMPVGWAPSGPDLGDTVHTADLSPAQWIALVYAIGAVFALIALMPDFDGWSVGDWDRQEGDEADLN